jgi:hypothetical protein
MKYAYFCQGHLAVTNFFPAYKKRTNASWKALVPQDSEYVLLCHHFLKKDSSSAMFLQTV